MDRIEVFTGVQRRRRYTAEEKAVMVAECLKPGMSVAFVAEFLQGVDDFIHGYCLSMARVIESYDSMYRCNRQ